MCNQNFIPPSIAVTGDTTGYMNVLSTTPGGEVQIVTTGATVNTIGPDRHVVIGDVLISPGHYKTIPTNYHVDGNITIENGNSVVVGDETVETKGILYVNGDVTATGDIDIDGDLVFKDSPIDSDNFGIKNGSADFTGWTVVGEGPHNSLYQKQITFIVPFVDDKYTVMLQPVNYPNPAGGPGSAHPGYLFPINKTPNGFKIYVHTVPADLEYIDWVAMKY